MRMDHIVPLLNVENVARSIEFYTTRLGFSVDNSWTPKDELAWSAGARPALRTED